MKLPLMKAGSPIAWAEVDDASHDELSRFRWYLLITRSGMRYAYRVERLPDGRKLSVSMHRQIMGLVRGDGKIVDHINRDSLDNRRGNLRLCTYSENNKNRAPIYSERCKSGHLFDRTKVEKGGTRRICSTCRAIWAKAYWAKRSARKSP